MHLAAVTQSHNNGSTQYNNIYCCTKLWGGAFLFLLHAPRAIREEEKKLQGGLPFLIWKPCLSLFIWQWTGRLSAKVKRSISDSCLGYNMKVKHGETKNKNGNGNCRGK